MAIKIFPRHCPEVSRGRRYAVRFLESCKCCLGCVTENGGFVPRRTGACGCNDIAVGIQELLEVFDFRAGGAEGEIKGELVRRSR